MGKFLELMRVGKFKDRHGVEYDITRGVLDKLVETFTPSKPPALLVGHPDVAKPPLFGVVDALKVAGDKLLFRPAKFAAEFAAMVAQGKFPGVSAGLDKDLSRLDHVALLSAQKPAIDGLAPVAEFSAQPEGETVSLDVTDVAASGLAEFARRIELVEMSAPYWWMGSRLKDIGGVLRGLKNSLIEADGVEKAEAVIPEYVINRLMEDPPEPVEETGGVVSEFAAAVEAAKIDEGAIVDTIDYEARYNEMLPQFENALKTITTIQDTNKRLAADNKALAVKLDAALKHSRLVEFEAWVEERIADGRVLPDEKVAIVERMERLCQQCGAEFSSDPEGNPYPLDHYKQEIMNRPKRRLCEAVQPPEFSKGGVDVTPGEFGKLVHRYQDEMKSKGVTVELLDAVDHVRGQLGQS